MRRKLPRSISDRSHKKAVVTENSDNYFISENCTLDSSEMPIKEKWYESDKESCAPATGSRSPEAQNPFSDDIYDDIPIAIWL